MLIKVIIPVLFSSLCFFLMDCSSMRNHNPEPFNVKEAYYQSWVVSDDEKGTDIVLTMNDVKQGVEFDSIVFRGVRMRAFVTQNNYKVSIKSILPSGKSRIKMDITVVNLPDQLIYHYHGVRISYPFKTIKGKMTKFYKID